MKNNILNEGYANSKIFFEKAYKDKIYEKNKIFIDLSNCAGSILLGHNYNYFNKSIKEYVNKKISNFAHPNVHASNFSKTIKKIFPSFSDLIYCNSGTEAVTKSLRVCRAISKKKLIVSVSGSWHGSVDNLLFYPGKNFKPNPLSAGLSDDLKKNLYFIPYGNIEESKKILEKIKKNINCLIIEPVQASLPLTNPKEYLKFLENYCKKNNIILIFDEIISGIRSNKYSVQKNYNIKPDITIIGKVFGGGLPIGIIGITKKIKQKLIKKNKKVFFGGTFSGNSLSTYMGNQIISYILKNKNVINEINKKSQYFQTNLNNYILKNNLDIKVYRYSSIIRIVYTKMEIQNRMQRDFFENKVSKKIKLLRKYLLDNGIYYPSNGIIFFSFSTSYKSINYVINILKKGFTKYF